MAKHENRFMLLSIFFNGIRKGEARFPADVNTHIDPDNTTTRPLPLDTPTYGVTRPNYRPCTCDDNIDKLTTELRRGCWLRRSFCVDY